MVLLASNLPRIALSPFAGALVDRWDRRWAMILSDGGAGLGTILMFILFLNDAATIPWLVAIGAFSSAFQAFQWPAYQAAISLLVPKKNYQRASGMVQMAEALSQLIAPLFAALVIVNWGVTGLVAIDVVTFTFAIGTLFVVKFPRPPETEVGKASRGSLLSEAACGYKYLDRRHGLLALLIFFMAINLAFGFIAPVFVAYMLSVGTETSLGLTMTLGSTGMLVGSVVASSWKGTEHKIRGILITSAILGVMLMTLTLTESPVVIVGSMFIGMFMIPIAAAMSQAIWLAKVEPDVQGRVFSVRIMLAQALLPIAYLLAGPLADKVFVPLMTGDSTLGLWLQGMLGAGTSRGYALFFLSLGVFVVAAAVASYLYPPLRHLERDIPDFDTPASSAETSPV
jgi:MFS family permease